MTATQTWNTTDLVNKDKAHLLHPVSNLHDLRNDGPLVLAQGEGVYLWDTDGNRYIDAFAGLWNVRTLFPSSFLRVSKRKRFSMNFKRYSTPKLGTSGSRY